MYKEDFECERRDREAAQAKISQLENELSIATRQVRRGDEGGDRSSIRPYLVLYC